MNALSSLRQEVSRDRITVWMRNRDADLNVLNQSWFNDLVPLLDQWERSASQLPIVFRSDNPTGFMAGFDLQKLASFQNDQEALDLLHRGRQVLHRLGNLQRHTIAFIQGCCLGGGMELAFSCRFRIGCENGRTKFGFPESKSGLFPAWGGVHWLLQRIDVRVAMRMLLSGNPINLDQAYDLGIVDEITVEGTEDLDLNHFLQICVHQPLPPTVWETQDLLWTQSQDLIRTAKEVADFEFNPLSPAQRCILQAALLGFESSPADNWPWECNTFLERLRAPDTRQALERFSSPTPLTPTTPIESSSKD